LPCSTYLFCFGIFIRADINYRHVSFPPSGCLRRAAVLAPL
jgi:hypothetical protein